MKEQNKFLQSKENTRTKKKRQITINLDADIIDFFKVQSATLGIPYQTLINSSLKTYIQNKTDSQDLI